MENNFNKPPQEDSNKIPEEETSIGEEISQESDVDNEPFGHYSEAETKNPIERQNEEGEKTTEKTPQHQEEQKPDLSKETLLFTLDNFLNDITQQYEKVANYPPHFFGYINGHLVIDFNNRINTQYAHESISLSKILNNATEKKEKLTKKNNKEKSWFTSQAKFEAEKIERNKEIEDLTQLIENTRVQKGNLHKIHEDYKSTRRIPVPDNLQELFTTMTDNSMKVSPSRLQDVHLVLIGATDIKTNLKDLCTQLKEYARVNLKDRV